MIKRKSKPTNPKSNPIKKDSKVVEVSPKKKKNSPKEVLGKIHRLLSRLDIK